jgi:hypothetical protein
MQCLVVQFFIQTTVALVGLLLLEVDFLKALHFRLLLHSVVLEDCELFTHLLLHEHVILHATLEHLGNLATLVTDPTRIALFVQISVGNRVDVKQDVVCRLIRAVNHARLLIKVQASNRPPINVLLLVPLEVEVAVAEDVILVVDHFDLTIFELLLGHIAS